MTAVTFPPAPHRLPGGGEICGYNMPAPVVGVRLWCCYGVVFFCSLEQTGEGLLFGNHIVDASSLVSLYRPFGCEPLLNGFAGWCVV